MRKLNIISLGHTKERWLQEAMDEYIKRLKGNNVAVNLQFAKHDKQFAEWVDRVTIFPSNYNPNSSSSSSSSNAVDHAFVKANDHICLLDERGKQFTSEEFSTFLFDRMYGSHSTSTSTSSASSSPREMSFIIGGADGFPAEWRRRYQMMSLSKLVFTHQVTRLVLLEQIYRATEIKKGSGYHRGN